MGLREQSHAKKSSPGFAVNRYATGGGTQRPKLPAPSVSKKRKDEMQDDDVPIKKKKKKTGMALATESQLKQIDQLAVLADKTKKVGTVFGIKKTQIMEAVENGQIDFALQQFRRQAYATIVNLIPIAEKEYARGKRDHQAYVLNALITQGRELASDLMADGDSEQIASKIIHEVLEPLFKGILQNFVSEMQELKFVLSDKVEPGHRIGVSQDIDGRLKKLAGIMSELYGVSSAQVRRNLLGE